ncbi:nickel/cobalt transporter [Gaiella sp.]|uniref:nickel/cobalt transporter n=1 Tax=Gaiella sp. TaxID=2663207 RepID=UPI00398371E1
MRRVALLVVVAVAATCALLAPAPASAHPLGNFTVNHFAGIDLAGDTVYVRFALDLAEIPTFQEGASVRRPGYAASLAKQLDLTVDGKQVPLIVVAHRTAERPGAGGLKTLRFDAIYRAPAAGTRLTFADRSFASRIGWREITINARDGARLDAASAPQTTRSDELRAYPKDLLRSPLDVRSATAGFSPGPRGAAPPVIGEAAAVERSSGGFESLIERGDLSLGVILISLLIAAFWGSVHALTPGHGKALVAGYLVGTKGKPRHAFLLGATVTVTHTFGVFALGLVTLLLSQFIVPDQLYPWLTLVSGLLVVLVGVGVLRSRLRTGGWADHDHGDGLHDHGSHGHHHEHGDHQHHDDHHGHVHAHGDDHEPASHTHAHRSSSDDSFTSKGILGVGIAAGLLPCPSALVVLLSAIAVHRVGFGFALIAAFSLGLAATITCIGLIAVLARRAFRRVSFEGRIVRALPALSALVILGVGVALTIKAIPGVI